MAYTSRSTYGLEPPRVEDWRSKALCREAPDDWFEPTERSVALHICRTHCTVAGDCLRDALAYPPADAVQGGVAFNHKRMPLPGFWHAPVATCPRCVEFPPKGAPTDDGACGEYAGYRRHLQLGEEACDRCKAAAVRQQRERRLMRARRARRQKEA